MSTTRPLYESASIIFDANGQGTVIVGPNVYGTIWNISRVTTTCTSPNTNQVTFTIYRGYISPGMQIGGTYSGQQDSDETSINLKTGDQLVGQWTGGNSGDVGTMTVFGTQTDLR